MIQDVKRRMTEKMDGAIEFLRKELASLRTGRASLSILDGVTVEYYGVPTPLSQVAALAVPESRLITIQPWEQRLIPEIEKAIAVSGLGLTPSNDGKIIRVSIPYLTEERRKDLVKIAKKTAEDGRVALRNIRRDANDELKKLEKQSGLSEDDVRKAQDEIQKATDQYIHKADDLLRKKEAEIMEI
ncbi:MAG: ribosome recycling factor [Nitrospirae bacterium]|nr:ribosome recycling factor [Nitrospirota bacterium]